MKDEPTTGVRLLEFAALAGGSVENRQRLVDAITAVLETVHPENPLGADIPFGLPEATALRYMELMADQPRAVLTTAATNARMFTDVAQAFGRAHPGAFADRLKKRTPEFVGPLELNSHGLAEHYLRQGGGTSLLPVRGANTVRRVFGALCEVMPETYGTDPEKVPLAGLKLELLVRDYEDAAPFLGRSAETVRHDTTNFLKVCAALTSDGQSHGYDPGLA